MPRAFDDAGLLERVDNDWEFLTETVQMLAADGPTLVAPREPLATEGVMTKDAAGV